MIRPKPETPGLGEALAAEATPPIPGRLLASLVAFVLAVGVLGWLWRGNADGLTVGPADSAAARAAASGEQAPSAEQIEAMLDRLRQRLKERPDDLEGWTMLARSMSVLRREPEAVTAWRRVTELSPQSAAAWADLADAVATANGGDLRGEPAQLIAKSLQLDPQQAKALALAGSAAFQQNDFARAVSVWQQALTRIEPGSDFAQQIQSALAEAQGRLAGAGSAPGAASAAAAVAAATPATPAAANGRVAGRVRLAAAIADQVQPGDTLFVFARPADGSRMPLAILKRQAGQLPLDFVLDDSLAMNPAMKLSGQARVVVGARISKSGQAMPQPGDLQGFSAPVAVGAEGVVVEIAEAVR